MKLLNVGCGSTLHSSWVNIDISYSPEVQFYDIRKGIPYSSGNFDACYSSHVLEHLDRSEARQLLGECFRVLKPLGVIRLVVPDLESIVKNYLFALQQVEVGKKESEHNYDWMMLELYDQTIRSFSGGEMGRFLSKPDIDNKDFIVSRIGNEVINYWEKEQEKQQEKKSLWERIRYKKLSWYIKQFPNLRNSLAKCLVAAIAGNEAKQAFEEGLFRNSGEIHKWMYDRFSLRRLLEQSGFVDVCVCDADESRIPNFNSYNLDVIETKVRKPDSLFMEGIKP